MYVHGVMRLFHFESFMHDVIRFAFGVDYPSELSDSFRQLPPSHHIEVFTSSAETEEHPQQPDSKHTDRQDNPDISEQFSDGICSVAFYDFLSNLSTAFANIFEGQINCLFFFNTIWVFFREELQRAFFEVFNLFFE